MKNVLKIGFRICNVKSRKRILLKAHAGVAAISGSVS